MLSRCEVNKTSVVNLVKETMYGLVCQDNEVPMFLESSFQSPHRNLMAFKETIISEKRKFLSIS